VPAEEFFLRNGVRFDRDPGRATRRSRAAVSLTWINGFAGLICDRKKLVAKRNRRHFQDQFRLILFVVDRRRGRAQSDSRHATQRRHDTPRSTRRHQTRSECERAGRRRSCSTSASDHATLPVGRYSGRRGKRNALSASASRGAKQGVITQSSQRRALARAPYTSAARIGFSAHHCSATVRSSRGRAPARYCRRRDSRRLDHINGDRCALQHDHSVDVRDGSLADIAAATSDVCFTPESGQGV